MRAFHAPAYLSPQLDHRQMRDDCKAARQLHAIFPKVDGSLTDVSDGLTLPWINGDLNSKPLQQTPVSVNDCDSSEVRSGH